MENLNKYLLYKITEYLGYFEEGKINVLSKKINNKISLIIKYNNFTLTKSCKVYSYNKYSHLNHYIYLLKKVEIPKKIKYMMKIMFNEIIEVYNKVKPKNRRTFLNFDYCSIQFLKILDEKEYISEFSQFNCVSNLMYSNHIFEQICKEKQWKEWIPDWKIEDDDSDEDDDYLYNLIPPITHNRDLGNNTSLTFTLPSIIDK